MSKKPTRYFSKKQEKRVAKETKGKTTPNSGATPFQKGDVLTEQILIECKTKMSPSKSHSIKKKWLEDNQKEAYQMRRLYSALAFDFGESPTYYIIDQNLFNLLQKKLMEEDE